MTKLFFGGLCILSLFIPPAIALFCGIAFALLFKNPSQASSGTLVKYLLQISVIGLGFGMNLHESLQSSKEGMLMTIGTVAGVMLVGVLLGRWLRVGRHLSYLIAAGTAICGGSAIAAIAPVIRPDRDQTSISLAVIFTLNAIALFVFPPIGRLFELTQQEFGLWAAIAIHDTSSVVAAGADYGPQALVVATTVKLTRALWIIPLALVSGFLFRRQNEERQRITIPWFIFLFIAAMTINTYLPIESTISATISSLAHRLLGVTLFLIGTALSPKAISRAGMRPIVLGVLLWCVVSLVSLLIIIL